MEKFWGKWESIPSQYENFDAFCDKMEIPTEQRDGYRNMVTVVTAHKEGDTIVSVVEIKGQPAMKQELKYKIGVPFEHTGIDGSKMNSVIQWSDGKMVEKHQSEKDGVKKEWGVERYVEGDFMVATSQSRMNLFPQWEKVFRHPGTSQLPIYGYLVSKRDGVSMKTKLKRI